jgi:hypothetical protein
MAEFTINVNRHREIVRWKIVRKKKPALTECQKVILMVLVDYINSQSRIAYPDFDLLAEKTGYHRTTVIEAINAGRKAKIVHRLRKGGKVAGRGLANEYTFPLTREEIVAHRLLISDTPPENSSQPAMELVASGHKNSSQPATPYSESYSDMRSAVVVWP